MSGLQTRILLDSNGQDLAIESTQDVEPILDFCKAARRQEQKSDWGRHIAEIPNVILTKWLNEELDRGNTTIRIFGPEMDALVARKLRDPDWAYLRTDAPSHLLGFGS